MPDTAHLRPQQAIKYNNYNYLRSYPGMTFANSYINLFEILLAKFLKAANWGLNETKSSHND